MEEALKESIVCEPVRTRATGPIRRRATGPVRRRRATVPLRRRGTRPGLENETEPIHHVENERAAHPGEINPVHFDGTEPTVRGDGNDPGDRRGGGNNSADRRDGGNQPLHDNSNRTIILGNIFCFRLKKNNERILL